MFALLLTLLPAARAETADEVIAKVRAANRVESSIQTVQMTLVSKTGSSRTREIELRTRREGDVVKTHMKMLAPSDVAGIQFLMVDNLGKPDEQYQCLPALHKVNQISGSARKGDFVGSDFTYEDLEIREAASGTHTLAGDTAEAWTIETQVAPGGAYSKIRSTIYKSDMIIHKVEFFDTAGALVKVLEVEQTAKDGAVTLPVRTKMTNVQKGTKTLLEITKHRIGVPKTELPDDTFTRAYLERGC